MAMMICDMCKKEMGLSEEPGKDDEMPMKLKKPNRTAKMLKGLKNAPMKSSKMMDEDLE